MQPAVLLRHLFDAAVARAQPARVLPAHLPTPPDPGKGRTVVIGAGKASGAMARALEAAWPLDHPLDGVVVTRYGHTPAAPARLAASSAEGHGGGRVRIVEAAHPVPDEAGEHAAQAIARAVQGLRENDLVIALMSGGGSALLAAPPAGLMSLADEQHLHRQLLRCGAPIGEMNTVRRHLSALKGGRLARLCGPARVLTLAISDVPGDALCDIASGPTVPDPSTCADALEVIERHGLRVPDAVIAALRDGTLETPKPGEGAWARHEARLIASPQDMLEAAADAARALGLHVHILSDRLQGEARDVGGVHAALALQTARHGQPFGAPCVLLSGGETTVTLPSAPAAAHTGTGGRCAEFALAAALALQGEPGVWLLAADTDGIDGHSEAAGALVTPDTLQRAGDLGIDALGMLRAHDAGGFFSLLGDQIVTGPTHTNVNDFRAVLVAPPGGSA